MPEDPAPEAAGPAAAGPAAAPFRGYRTVVGEEWIDYNGHLHDAGYAVVLSEANEALLAFLGLSAPYRAATGRAMYTAESHIRYLAEVRQGELIEAASLLVSADAKRLRVHTVLSRAGGPAAATGEYLFLHVDQAAGRVTAMPPDRQRAAQLLAAAQAGLERPAHLGLGVGSRSR